MPHNEPALPDLDSIRESGRHTDAYSQHLLREHYRREYEQLTRELGHPTEEIHHEPEQKAAA